MCKEYNCTIRYSIHPVNCMCQQHISFKMKVVFPVHAMQRRIKQIRFQFSKKKEKKKSRVSFVFSWKEWYNRICFQYIRLLQCLREKYFVHNTRISFHPTKFARNSFSSGSYVATRKQVLGKYTEFFSWTLTLQYESQTLFQHVVENQTSKTLLNFQNAWIQVVSRI
jgi:hypothetical protein